MFVFRWHVYLLLAVASWSASWPWARFAEAPHFGSASSCTSGFSSLLCPCTSPSSSSSSCRCSPSGRPGRRPGRPGCRSIGRSFASARAMERGPGHCDFPPCRPSRHARCQASAGRAKAADPSCACSCPSSPSRKCRKPRASATAWPCPPFTSPRPVFGRGPGPSASRAGA